MRRSSFSVIAQRKLGRKSEAVLSRADSAQSSPISDKGLTFEAVIELANTYRYQGYSMFFDNSYTSPALLHALKEGEIGATGTLRTNRKEVPKTVVQLQKALKRTDVPCGTDY